MFLVAFPLFSHTYLAEVPVVLHRHVIYLQTRCSCQTTYLNWHYRSKYPPYTCRRHVGVFICDQRSALFRQETGGLCVCVISQPHLVIALVFKYWSVHLRTRTNSPGILFFFFMSMFY